MLKKKHKKGDTVKGEVISHFHFGFFVEIENENHLGLVQIVDIICPIQAPLTTDDFPPIGSKYEFTVISYTEDDRNQIWLKWNNTSPLQS